MISFNSRVEGATLFLETQVARLSAATARQFKADCEEIWEPTITSVEANLSSIEFIDSSGIEALLSLYKRQPPANPNVRLTHVRPPVQAVIELLRLHRIFEIIS